MNVSGERLLPVPLTQVWVALHDLDVLRETIPGCQDLRQVSPTTYEGAASVGVAAIKGLYRGKVEVLEEREEAFMRLSVNARSGHAEIKGEGSLELLLSDGGTLLRYSGDARISGPLALVGQRLLPAAAKSLTEQFFDNLERRLRNGAFSSRQSGQQAS